MTSSVAGISFKVTISQVLKTHAIYIGITLLAISLITGGGLILAKVHPFGKVGVLCGGLLEALGILIAAMSFCKASRGKVKPESQKIDNQIAQTTATPNQPVQVLPKILVEMFSEHDVQTYRGQLKEDSYFIYKRTRWVNHDNGFGGTQQYVDAMVCRQYVTGGFIASREYDYDHLKYYTILKDPQFKQYVLYDNGEFGVRRQ